MGMRQRRRRQLRKKQFTGIGILCLFAILFCSRAAMASEDTTTHIIMKSESFQMKQEEELPAYKVNISFKGDDSTVLDETTGYNVKDFIKDLNDGKDYTIDCKADGVTEGTFPINIVMDKGVEKKIYGEWFGKVNLELDAGNAEIQNKAGTWDGDNKFKDWSGNPVVSAWVNSMGKAYYFGEDGVKVTGEQSIGGKNYVFNKKGVCQKDTWYDYDGGKAYLSAEDGSMVTGWEDIDKKTYFFGSDYKMVTGNQQLGVFKCVFKEDGSLESKEETVDTTKPMIAVTFDDGPGEDTSRLLDALEQYGAHATFFMLGQNVELYPDQVKRMEDIGCELGNHSWDHPQLTTLSSSGVQRQIGDTNEAISKIVGHGATVLRPPYGDTNDAVSAEVGLPQILWSVDTLDWKTKDANATVQAIMTAQDGDIVLLHDIHSWSVDAIITALPQLTSNGFQLLTVSELASAKGIDMENGGKYADFYTQDAEN